MKNLIFILYIFPCMVFADNFYTSNPENAPRGIVIIPSKGIKSNNTKSYIYNEHNNALAIIKDNKNPEINDSDNPTDTHMKSDFKKIKLGFSFTPLSFIQPIGYAVGGVYLKDKGWTAISTFFNKKELGSCKFKINSMQLSHGAVQIPQDDIRYDINNKISSIYVEGAPKSGFVYDIMWDDNNYNYFLECANPLYDSMITLKMIELAKKIDKSGNGLK